MRHLIRTNILAFVFFLAAAGCVAHKPEVALPDDLTLDHIPPGESAVHRIHSKVVFIDHRSQPVDIDNFPEGLTLVLAAVPGQINGMSQGKVMRMVPAKLGSEIQIDLDGMEAKVGDSSTTMANNPYTEGLSVVPPSTKFSRLGTVSVDATTGKPFGWTSFMDSESRDSLILVYTDRPCSMTGTAHMSGESYQYDIQLKTPGFHWIRSFKLADRRFIFKKHSGRSEVYFTIQNRDQIL